MNKAVNQRSSEHGGAGAKFLCVAVVLVLLANAGINYIPVAYNAENLKQEMGTAVIQGISIPGKRTPVEIVRQRLQMARESYDIPEDALVEVKLTNNILQAHVAYTKEVSIIPFGIYNYQYEFNHTATPAGFLTKQ